MKSYVIVQDNADGGLTYYVRTGLGIFWECTSDSAEARRFSTRALASKILRGAGKHLQGWRVLVAS